jgi:hypothetical protein
MQLPSELITGLVAIGSSLVGALPGMISGHLTNKTDEKKQLRELIMKTTAENWRFILENARRAHPFEHYMICTAMMCDIAFSKDKITEEKIKDHLEKVNAVMDMLSVQLESNTNK